MDDDLPYNEVVGGMLPPQKGNTMLAVKVAYNPPGGGWDVTRVIRIRSDQTPREIIKECSQHVRSHYGLSITPEEHVLQLHEPPGIIIESAVCSSQRILDFPCVATKVALKQEICFRLLRARGNWNTLPKYSTRKEPEMMRPIIPPPSIEKEKDLLQRLANVVTNEMKAFSTSACDRLARFDERLKTLFIKSSKVHTRTKTLTKHANDADTYKRLKEEFETSIEAFNQLKESQAVREASLCDQLAEHEKRQTDYDLLKSEVQQHLSGLDAHLSDYITLSVDKLDALQAQAESQQKQIASQQEREAKLLKQIQTHPQAAHTTTSTSPIRQPWNNSTVVDTEESARSPIRSEKSFSNLPSPTGISRIDASDSQHGHLSSVSHSSPFSSRIETASVRNHTIANSVPIIKPQPRFAEEMQTKSVFDGRPLVDGNTASTNALRILNENSPGRSSGRKPIRKRPPPQGTNHSVSFDDGTTKSVNISDPQQSVIVDTPQSLSVLEQDLLVERAWVSSMTKELYLDRRHGMPSKKSLGLYREYQSLSSSAGSPRRLHTGPCNDFKKAWNKPVCENCGHTAEKCKPSSRGSPGRRFTERILS